MQTTPSLFKEDEFKKQELVQKELTQKEELNSPPVAIRETINIDVEINDISDILKLIDIW